MRRKYNIITIVLLLLLQFEVQHVYSQFGFKKLKDQAVQSVKNKAMDKAFDKITNLCTGDENEETLIVIDPSDKAFAEYELLKKDIDTFEIHIEAMNIMEIGKDVKQIKQRIEKIKELNSNANLTQECTRITQLKSKFKQ